MTLATQTTNQSNNNDLMHNLYKIISDTLSIPFEIIKPALSYQSIGQWSSLGHINLMVALEKNFNIKINQEDVVELNSVENISKFICNEKISLENDTYKDYSKNIHRGLNDINIDETRISHIDTQNAKLAYRGYNIGDLIKSTSIEQIIHLFIYGKFANENQLLILKKELIHHRSLPKSIIDLIKIMSQSGQPAISVLRTGISALVSTLNNLSDETKIIAYIVKSPMILGYWRSFSTHSALPKYHSKHSYIEFVLLMLLGYLPDKKIVELYERNMILTAENGCNAATFVARTCVSTNAEIGEAFTAAASTFSGPLHGGAILETMKMLEEIGDIESVSRYLNHRIQTKRPIFGFGHRVYKIKDPRAQYLNEVVSILCDHTSNNYWLNLLDHVESHMSKYTSLGLTMNVDFYASVSYKLMGLSNNLLIPIFVLNRLISWGAHILEQKKNNILIRPRLKYVGDTNKKIPGNLVV